MPNRLFQGIINQMREVLDRTIGVVDDVTHLSLEEKPAPSVRHARALSLPACSAGHKSVWITAHIRPLATPCTRIMRYLWTVRTI